MAVKDWFDPFGEGIIDQKVKAVLIERALSPPLDVIGVMQERQKQIATRLIGYHSAAREAMSNSDIARIAAAKNETDLVALVATTESPSRLLQIKFKQPDHTVILPEQSNFKPSVLEHHFPVYTPFEDDEYPTHLFSTAGIAEGKPIDTVRFVRPNALEFIHALVDRGDLAIVAITDKRPPATPSQPVFSRLIH